MKDVFPLPALAFLALIETTQDLLGTATSAALRNAGKKVAAGGASLEDLQGAAEQIKPGVYVQKQCPFADAVKLYLEQGRAMPSSVKSLANFANAHGGAWVSAFCGVHQALRLALEPRVVQVACKGGDGSVNYAPNDVVSEEEARRIIEKATCIYAVPFKSE